MIISSFFHYPQHLDSLRKGYFSEGGSFDEWKKAMTVLLHKQPVMSILMAAAAGSLLREIVPSLSPSWIHLQGGSSIGKTMALKMMVSLRTNPETIVWCFADGTTLKVYTQAADGHFLCLDNAHVAIIPDNEGGARPIPNLYLQHMSGQLVDNSEPSVTIITTGDKKANHLSDKSPVFEIINSDSSIWVTPENEHGWWMDKYIPTLYDNYGWVPERIKEWFLGADLDYESTLVTWRKAGFNLSKIPKGVRDLMVLMEWGMTYLKLMGVVTETDESWRKTAKRLYLKKHN